MDKNQAIQIAAAIREAHRNQAETISVGLLEAHEHQAEQIAAAIRDTLISPNVPDARGEAANLVDTTSYMANGVSGLRKALQEHSSAVTEAAAVIAAGLHDLADAIREREG